MQIPVSWTCPKCNTVNVTLHNSDDLVNRNVEFCDTEIGGCDEMYVIKTVREIVVEQVYATNGTKP